MLEHTKRQVDMIKTNMFITAVCILFLIKLRWPSNKSQYTELQSTIWFILHASYIKGVRNVAFLFRLIKQISCDELFN